MILLKGDQVKFFLKTNLGEGGQMCLFKFKLLKKLN